MSSRIHPRTSGLVLLFALCALAACNPATPSSAQTTSGSTAAAAATDAAPASADAPSGLAAAAALNPLTSPKDAVTASMKKFLALRSYHASMQVSGGPQGAVTNEVDFVAPDRYRMQMPMGTQYIVGDTMYMDMQGKILKVPMPKGTLSQWRDPVKLAENAATMTVEAQGSEMIDGDSARKYLVHNTQPQPSDVTMWIGGDGLPVQIGVSGAAQDQSVRTTIRYSRFNDPTLRVDPP